MSRSCDFPPFRRTTKLTSRRADEPRTLQGRQARRSGCMVSLLTKEESRSRLLWGVAREVFRSGEALTSCCRLTPSRRLKSLLRLEALTSYHQLPHQLTRAKEPRVLVPFFFLFGEIPCPHPRPSLR